MDSQASTQPIKIFIKTLRGKRLEVEVGPEELVTDVMEKVKAIEGIPNERQKLIIAGHQLNPDRKFFHYCTENNRTIHLLLRGMQIFVENSVQHQVILDVGPSDPIKMVKIQVEDKTSIPPESQKLIFDHQELDDDLTLTDYNVREKAVVHLNFHPPTAPFPPVPPGAALKGIFLKHITIPDGHIVAPNTHFTKKWLLRNDSHHIWQGCICRPLDLNETSGAGCIVGKVPCIPPGRVGAVAVHMIAPSRSGTYRINWTMEKSNGEPFGPPLCASFVIINEDEPDINVSELSRQDLEAELFQLRRQASIMTGLKENELALSSEMVDAEKSS